jgi:Big-like domain-containing protein
MSAGQASNSYLYGGKDGNAASVTAGGNLGAQLNFTNVVNIGRLVLRTGRITRLQDIPVSLVMVFNPTGNGNVWYAGYDTNAPAVGVGMPIPAGTSVNLPCTDANQISFIPEVDGNQIYVLALASGSTVPSTPSNPPAFTNTPPTITPFNPAINNATNIPVFQPISVQASAPLDATTVNNTTVTATPTMTATISVDSSNPMLIVVQPTANLTVSTTYHITYGTGIADLNGNTLASPFTLNFTTAATVGTPDTTPPVLVATSPVAFSSGFNPSLLPTLVFSEAISLSSINANNITAFLTNNNQQIQGLVFTQSTDLKSIFINNMNLVQSQNYQINVIGGASGLMDLSGNHFATTFSIPFATSAPSGNNIYSVSGNSYDALQSNGYLETSIYLKSSRSLLVGKVPTNYTFILKRVGSPSGNITFVWERNSFNGYSDFRILATIAASSISNSGDQIITISDTGNTHSFSSQDLISVRYQGGNSSNYILVKTSNYDAFDGSNTVSQKTDSNFDDTVFSSSDLAGTITVVA